MSESIKESELRIWHETLENEDRRIAAPDHYVGELQGHAKALSRLGIIDLWELRELMELADAAYSHSIEEQHTREWLKTRE
jgi:hypothetical protein